MDPYRTLRIELGVTESDVKKAFRRLALKYHPDVCRGSNCGVQFHVINEAYDTVMSQLRGGETEDLEQHGFRSRVELPLMAISGCINGPIAIIIFMTMILGVVSQSQSQSQSIRLFSH